MAELDGTDREILRLLMEDARRSYREIGEVVGLSPPAISDRIRRLEESGVVRGFTVDVDRSTLAQGDAVLIEMRIRPGTEEEVMAALRDVGPIEDVTRTVDSRVVARGFMSGSELQSLVAETLADEWLESYDVRKVAEVASSPQLGDGDLVLDCVECGKPIEGEGVTVTVEGERYHLCCTSCESLFLDRYEDLRSGAE